MHVNRKEKSILGFFAILSCLCFIYLSFQSVDIDHEYDQVKNTFKTEQSADSSFSDEESTPDIRYFNKVLDQMKYLSFSY